MESIGEYEYSKKDLIGHGAFAVVFKGRHKKKHDFVVAIKCITKKNLAKSQSLLSKEIKILRELSDLHHENVVALLDCKETTHHVYLVMEYCNGGDLADYLQAKGTLSEDTIALFLKQIAGAMKALNAKGIVHRDMKPQNILLTHSSSRSNPPAQEMQLKIADFGFARFLQDGVMAATLCGSPMYMAPEVIMSLQYDAKADLWSIGTIVYQCLTGKAPFQAQTPQQLKQFYEKNANLQPNIPGGTSPELKHLLMGLLRRNAKDRIDFDEFFNHPYVNPKAKPAASSPVPVPRSRSRSSLGESPNMKAVSASPLSGNVAAAAAAAPPLPLPPMPTPVRPAGQEPMDTAEAPRQQAATLAQQEDFVLVPEDIPARVSDGIGAEETKTDLNAIFSDPTPEVVTPSVSKHQTPPRSVRPTPYTPSHHHHRKSPPSPTQTSPSRPSTLPVQSPAGTPPNGATAAGGAAAAAVAGGSGAAVAEASQPIPVPSQVKAYEQIQRSIQGLSPSSSPRSPSPAAPPSSPRAPPSPRGMPIPPRRVGSNTSLASVGSISPPSVQFSIGTPPTTTGWKRTPSSPAVVTVMGSPHRKAAGTALSKLQTATATAGQAHLPPIVGSPTKTTTGFLSPADDSPTKPISTPFASGRNRARTCPAHLEEAFSPQEYGCGAMVPVLMERSNSDMDLDRSRSAGQLIKAAFGGQLPSPPNSLTAGLPMCLGHTPPSSTTAGGSGLIVRYGSSSSQSSLSHAGSNTSLHRTRTYSDCTPGGTEGSAMSSSPASAGTLIPSAQSPSNMEGPISFVAPELAEETLMDKEHNETVAKLNFILALVECIIELAQSRSSPLTQSMTEKAQQQQLQTNNTGGGTPGTGTTGQGLGFQIDHVAFMSEHQRRLEQMVLYVRALQLLTSSIQLAKDEVRGRRLQPSNAVKSILKDMNNYYHQCLVVCKNLHGKGAGSPETTETSLATSAVTADKLIYTYAIEICQTAALDELFGNPQECFRRYRNAQILLHSLAQQAQNDTDRELLNKYREAVEKRLYNLHSQGYVQVDASMSTGS